MTSTHKYNFSIDDTNQAKGIALILLLWYHLFVSSGENFGTWNIGDVEIVRMTARFSQICVGVFVFLSGYGLYRSQIGKQIGIKSFYLKHYTKLYETYWLIWIIFVPISIFVFNRTFSSVYPENTLLHIILNFFGLQYTMLDFGYNPTWWFMSCIIILYFLYPFLKALIDKFNFLILLMTLVFSIFAVNISFAGFQPYAPVEEYLLTFVLGVFVAKYNLFVRIKELKYSRLLKFAVLIVLFIVFVFFRFQLGKKSLILTDGVLTLVILQFMFLLNRNIKFLIFIGKHSYSIFLFHTFIL